MEISKDILGGQAVHNKTRISAHSHWEVKMWSCENECNLPRRPPEVSCQKVGWYAERRPQTVSTANLRVAIWVAPVKGHNCLRSWGSDHSTRVPDAGPDAKGFIVCHVCIWFSFGLISPYYFLFLPFGKYYPWTCIPWNV
jgi:hypothetical protein